MKPSFILIGGAGALTLVVGVFAFLPKTSVVSRDTQHVSRPLEREVTDVAKPDQKPVYDYDVMRVAFAGKDVERLPIEKKLIALTFDGGGNAHGTERILEILASNGIRSTFFLTGRFVELFPDQVKAIIGAGHEIANHTMTHARTKELDQAGFLLELSGMENVARTLSISVAPFFRFPYGEYKKEDIGLVNEKGYVSVRWSVDSWGWKGVGDSVDSVFVSQKVISAARPGAIALMHLGSSKDGSTLDADALPSIISELSLQGYELVTLSELFSVAR